MMIHLINNSNYLKEALKRRKLKRLFVLLFLEKTCLILNGGLKHSTISLREALTFSKHPVATVESLTGSLYLKNKQI